MRQEPPAVSDGMQWLTVAAESGVAVAATLLGQLLYGFAPETSVRWLESAEADDPRATYLLGLIAFHGRPDAPADHALARRRYLAAAARGNADAMFECGLMLMFGYGGARNESEAQAWEQRAAEAGHARACLNLGARAARREGGFRRMAEAVDWYKRAANAGSAEAAARLSRMRLVTALQWTIRNRNTGSPMRRARATAGRGSDKQFVIAACSGELRSRRSLMDSEDELVGR